MSDIAILFPGQGSQEKGMGRDVAEAHDWAMDLWKLAEDESGLPLREIYWDGEDADMADTKALQPALTVTDLTLWRAAADHIKPMAAAGHSLGEYPALAAAGVLSPADAVKAVAVRGKLMAGCGCEGQGMSAIVKLEQDAVAEIVDKAARETGDLLLIANYNSPAQFVVSGMLSALGVVGDLAREMKGRAIPLAVSGAFHSPLIGEAAKEFSGVLRKLAWSEPKIPVFLNVTAQPEADPAKLSEIMMKQMTSPVRWIKIMSNMYGGGARCFVEFGPKSVLSKLAGMNLKGKDGVQTKSIGTLERAQEI